MKTIGDRLREARIAAGFETQQEAAEALGVRGSTYASHEGGTRGIKEAVLAKYARRFRVSPVWLMFGKDTEATPLQDERLDLTVGLKVWGTIAAGTFLEIDGAEVEREKETIGVGKDMRFAHAEQYALLVTGDSMNLEYPDGCYVTCVELYSSGLDLAPGMVVHVERSINDGQLVETTLKEIQSMNGQTVLVPRSTNPKHKPLIIEGDESTEVKIRGIVTGMWKPRKF